MATPMMYGWENIKIMLTINYKKTITGLMALFVLSGALHAQSNEDSAKLTDLVSKVSQISVPTKSESEYQRALEAY
ncbi:MAG: hypothetical protein R6U42_03185, partial [Halomonas sp.]